jgi:vacuolar protein sorting-associated protein 13B
LHSHPSCASYSLQHPSEQILRSYVDRYISNIDLDKLSLWGGDLVLRNLELKLDVLEEEVDRRGIPISILSARIGKLQIHIPWSALLSQPVQVTIDLVECVVTSKDVDHSRPPATSATAESATRKDPISELPSYVQGIIAKMKNNLSISITNLVFKYVEDSIVLSVNLKSAEVGVAPHKLLRQSRAFVLVTCDMCRTPGAESGVDC